MCAARWPTACEPCTTGARSMSGTNSAGRLPPRATAHAQQRATARGSGLYQMHGGSAADHGAALPSWSHVGDAPSKRQPVRRCQCPHTRRSTFWAPPQPFSGVGCPPAPHHGDRHTRL
jgi:hypothetical protein